MSGGIYLIQHDKKLVEMTEAKYDSEDLLQGLLVQYPNLLAGDQMDASQPRSYDPLEDAENWETCPECGGTGGRDDGLGLRRLGEVRERACNGCAGKGWRAKCPAWFRDYEGDVQPVAGLLRRIEGHASGGPTEGGTPPQYLETYHPPVPPMVPFAVLVSDGEWHEDVETGPFGTPDDEPDAGEWMRTVAGLLAEHENCLTVVVDCHI